MALDTPGLKTGIEALANELYVNAGNLTPQQCATRFADQLSHLMEVYVKSGNGIYQPGSLVAGSSPVTAPVPINAVIKIN